MQNIADCFSNMLDSYNIAGWVELEMVSLPTMYIRMYVRSYKSSTFSDKSWPKSDVAKQFRKVCTPVGRKFGSSWTKPNN